MRFHGGVSTAIASGPKSPGEALPAGGKLVHDQGERAVRAELALLLVRGGVVGVHPAMLQDTQPGIQGKRLRQRRDCPPRDDGQGERHARGDGEQPVERRRRAHGIVVAPPQCGCPPRRSPDIEFSFEVCPIRRRQSRPIFRRDPP
jgi:hypothetical protein